MEGFADADGGNVRMIVSIALATAMATAPVGVDASVATTVTSGSASTSGLDRVPAQLDPDQRTAYKAVFQAIRETRWTDAQIQLDAMTPGPLHTLARAILFTAKGSPRVEVDALVNLLNQAPELPQAAQLARLAKSRGATELPPLPAVQTLIWQDGAPRRVHTKSVKSDQVAADLAMKMVPFVKADMGEQAQTLLEQTTGLGSDDLTEWQDKVAWIYFLQGDDANARAMAAKAQQGTGAWAVQGRWTTALAAWRQGDCATSEAAFEGVAARAADVDFRSAALYWAARSDMRCGRPDKVEARLQGAAQYKESFYGQLARQALGIRNTGNASSRLATTEWLALDKRPNVRVAAALVEIGEAELADSIVRQQARIGPPEEFASLVRLAEALDLPATTIWLAHNCPAGIVTDAQARYPAPNWKPDGGWRVDKALVYAHALEESRFRNTVTSPAGAYGLMQIMPAALSDYSHEKGAIIDRSALSQPSVNMEVGQRHLERLRDMSGVTGGLLPKVIAAYNAGPGPVEEWNRIVRDGGDPLLYIESIPYWETRGYVTTVLRNYWMYATHYGKSNLPSRAALAQGLWPRFPGLPGADSVRLDAKPDRSAVASLSDKLTLTDKH